MNESPLFLPSDDTDSCRREMRHAPRRARVPTLTALFAGGIVALLALLAGPAGATASVAPTSAVHVVTPAAGRGWIRFGHFVPGEGPVDVKVDGTTIATNLVFERVTSYVMVPAGAHTVTLVSGSPGASTTPIVSGRTTVPSGGAVTVAAVASTGLTASSNMGLVAGGIGLQAYTDNLAPPTAGDAKVRVIHTVPGAPKVSASLTSARVSAAAPALGLSAVAYGQASPYVSVAAGTYSVTVKAANGAWLAEGQHWTVPAGTVSSIVVIEASTGPTLEVLSDAVGVVDTPVGGLQTGLGGTAPRPTSLLRSAESPALAALTLLLLCAAVMFRAGPQRFRRLPVVAARRLGHRNP